MPASLLSVEIRGVRSYSPLEKRSQTIDFMPLTLIVGKNGSGKTTVIESLKFIISGEEPPHSDSRRNFIHTPKNDKLTRGNGHDNGYACIQIKFKNSFGEVCYAKREISLPLSGTKSTPSIASGYKIGQNSWSMVHKQDDWSKVLPKLFSLPNPAILSNVILCHQEDNLWCMGDSSSVKQIFDKIFGCEQYKREIKHIDDEIRNCKKDMQMCEKDVFHYGEKVKRKNLILSQVEETEAQLKKLTGTISELDLVLQTSNEKKRLVDLKLNEAEKISREVDKLKYRVKELNERDKQYQRSLQLVPVKRPAPVIRHQINEPVPKKKPAQDPTIVDLEFVTENFRKMTDLICKMPASDDLSLLKKMVDETLERVENLKKRFVAPVEEPAPLRSMQVDEEPVEDDFMEQVDRIRRDIQQNIDQNLNELKEIKEKIESIQRDSDSVGADVESSRKELKEIEQKLIKTRDKRSQAAGTKLQLERELLRIKNELKSYCKVNCMYSENLGKLVCNQIIIEDLEKLKKCFQESITSFHEQMIAKINEALQSRWKQIYQGGDISTILLVDEEITRGKDKKSFNYHMAMLKNGVQMKMREKSSAGQRALASIILRMTLAELFVRDFAFIALDEPTSNLDLQNVQALARSIGSYVRKRSKKGVNIQWIIITHDEQFLRALDEESSPYFYRIQIDPSDGCSSVEKISSLESDGFGSMGDVHEVNEL